MIDLKDILVSVHHHGESDMYCEDFAHIFAYVPDPVDILPAEHTRCASSFAMHEFVSLT